MKPENDPEKPIERAAQPEGLYPGSPGRTGGGDAPDNHCDRKSEVCAICEAGAGARGCPGGAHH